MKKHLVTVITPSLNQGQFIEQNILSVAEQTYAFIEHIVMDGGSTDGTIEILRKHIDKIKWVSEPDQGFADACNKGISMAKGDILTIQNSDDIYYASDSIAKAVKAFDDHPDAKMIFGDCCVMDSEGKIIKNGLGDGRRYSFEALVCSDFVIPQSSTFFKRSTIDEVGFLDPDLDWLCDTDLWLRIGAKFSIVYVPEVFSCYRVYSGQRSDQIVKHLNERKKLLDKFFSIPYLPQEIRRLRRKAYAGAYLYEASKLISVGELRRVEWLYLKAFLNHPRHLADSSSILNRSIRCYARELLERVKTCWL